jgi:hypothetical protein
MKKRLLLLSLAFLGAGFSLAQDLPVTVGELTKRGGAQVSGDELRSVLSDALVVGTQVGSATKFRNKYKADGTLEGGGVRETGEVFTLVGSWSVLGGGAVLQDVRPMPGRPFQARSYWYKLGGNYFQTAGTAEYEKVFIRELIK